MKKMIQNLFGWLIIFGITCVLAGVFGVDKFRMYFRVSIGLSIFITAICMLLLILGAVYSNNAFVKSTFGLAMFKLWCSFVVSNLAVILVTLAASRAFEVDFYMTYLLMSLGRCAQLGSSESNKNKNKDK